jgi:hypothetical protein
VAISLNPSSGAVTAAAVEPEVRIGGTDLEGIAYNRQTLSMRSS